MEKFRMRTWWQTPHI